MENYWKNWFFWTGVLVVLFLVVAGYNAMTADMTTSYVDRSGGTCDYAAASVAHGEMTVEEYNQMGCDDG